MMNPLFRAKPVRVAVTALTAMFWTGILGALHDVAALDDAPPAGLAREAPGEIPEAPAGEPPQGAPGAVSPIYGESGLFAQRVLKDPKKEEEEKKKEEEEEIPEEVTFDEPSQPRRTSPALAFLFSAGVPGAGQVYNGNRRALAYAAVEAVAWIAFFSFRSSGDKKQDEFEDFADEHWDYDEYVRRAAEGDTLPNGEQCPYDLEADSLITYFAGNNRQHYYEDIGKLDAYQCGWDSPDNRVTYRGLREDSNSLKSWSRRSLMLVFLNHLISGVDAFRTARSRQMALGDGTRLQMDLDGRFERPRAVLRVVHLW